MWVITSRIKIIFGTLARKEENFVVQKLIHENKDNTRRLKRDFRRNAACLFTVIFYDPT